MNRRDFLVSSLQALFLALFPWLRTERGLELAGRAAEAVVPQTERAIYKMGSFKVVFGRPYEVSPEEWSAIVRSLDLPGRA